MYTVNASECHLHICNCQLHDLVCMVCMCRATRHGRLCQTGICSELLVAYTQCALFTPQCADTTAGHCRKMDGYMHMVVRELHYCCLRLAQGIGCFWRHMLRCTNYESVGTA